MLRKLLVLLAEMEREMTADRTREKAFSMISQGYWTGGLVPLGYDLIDKKLVINSTEANLVHKIFQLYLEQPSTLKVAEKLNLSGYKIKVRKTKNGKLRGGGRYTKTAIAQILRNPIYIGKRQSRDKLFKGKHDRIISDETFNDVQKKLEQSKKEHFITYNSELPHTLGGIIHCGFCHKQLTTFYAMPRGKKYYFYRCTSRNKDTKARCKAKDLKAEDIETFIKKIIIQLASSKDFFNAIFNQIVKNSSVGLEKLKKDRINLSENISNIKKEMTNIVNSISQGDTKNIPKILHKKLTELELQEENIKSQLTELNSKIEQKAKQEIKKDDLKVIFQEYIKNYDKINIDKQRKINKLIFEQIISKVSHNSTIENEMIFKFRANGQIIAKWNDIISGKEISSNFRNLEITNNAIVVLPVKYSLTQNFSTILTINFDKINNYLNLKPSTINLLKINFGFSDIYKKTGNKLKKNLEEKITVGIYKTKTDLAKHVGLSDSYVCRVLKHKS